MAVVLTAAAQQQNFFLGDVTDMLFLQLSRAHEPTRDPGSPTRDPAMNSVTVSATFDVGRFLADNVGVAPTRPDMSPTFPTKLYFLRLWLNVSPCEDIP